MSARLLGALALGDVEDARTDQGPAAVGQGDQRHLAGDELPRDVHVDPLERGLGPFQGLADPVATRLERRPAVRLVGGGELEQPPLQQLLPGEARESDGLLVHVHEAVALGIEHHDGVGRVLDEGSVPLLARSQLRLAVRQGALRGLGIRARPLFAREELGVVDGDGRLVGEPDEDALVVIGEGARSLVDREDQALDTSGDRDGHAHHGGDALLDCQWHVVAGEAPVVDVVVRASRPAGQQDLAAQALARLEAHAEPVPGRRPGPVAEHHRAGRRVVHGDARDVRVAQLLDGARDALEHHGEIEGLVHAARELGEQLGLAPPPLRLAVETRVLERERGLIGKSLEQRRVGVEEDPALAIGHAERPDDAPLHAQRYGEHRPLARGHRLRAHVRGDDDARVVEEIRRPHGAAIGDGAARDPRSRRHHVAGNGVHARGGASRDGHERPVRLDQAEPRRAHAEDRQDALDGSPAHVAHVEALGEVLGEPGQRLGLMLPPAGLVVEPGIVEGDDGLVCEGLGHLCRLAGERASHEVGDGEHAEDAIGGEQRHREDENADEVSRYQLATMTDYVAKYKK